MDVRDGASNREESRDEAEGEGRNHDDLFGRIDAVLGDEVAWDSEDDDFCEEFEDGDEYPTRSLEKVSFYDGEGKSTSYVSAASSVLLGDQSLARMTGSRAQQNSRNTAYGNQHERRAEDNTFSVHVTAEDAPGEHQERDLRQV